MKGVIMTACLLALFIHGSRALSCNPCNEMQCRYVNPFSCDYGLGKDFCNCCDKCFQGVGDPCGGPFDSNGLCGGGLMCEYDAFVGTPNQSGSCVSIPTGGGIPPFCQQACDNCDDRRYPLDLCLNDIEGTPGKSCHICNPSIGASCGADDQCPSPLVCNYVGECLAMPGPNPSQSISQSIGEACSTVYKDCPPPLGCVLYNILGTCVSPCDCTGVVCITCTPPDQVGECECCSICNYECTSAWYCNEGETCQNGVCVSIPTGGGIPPFCQQACDNCADPSYPVDQCLADIDAQPGNSCHICNPSIGASCGADEECPSPLVCNSVGECLPTPAPNPSQSISQSIGEACSTVYNDCPPPLACGLYNNLGTCVSPCDCTGVVCITCTPPDQVGECECCSICDYEGEGTPCSDDSMCAYGFHCYMHVSYDGCDIDGVCVSDGTPTGVCGDCDSSLCWQMSDCYFGFDWDYCGCCQVCCMGPGEHCGGPNNIYGTCGVGFHCVPYDNSWDGYGYCDC